MANVGQQMIQNPPAVLHIVPAVIREDGIQDTPDHLTYNMVSRLPTGAIPSLRRAELARIWKQVGANARHILQGGLH